jgi:hypothetical protein
VRESDSSPGLNGWPLVAAFGLTLVFAGLLTHVMVSILGAITFGAWDLSDGFARFCHTKRTKRWPWKRKDWFWPTQPKSAASCSSANSGHRARLPLKIYPYSAGVRGGLVGGAAMAVLAILYGLIGHKSIWYPINLLAAAGSAQISAMSYDQLLDLQRHGLVLATIIHVARSALVGLLYGVALPMFPRRPILLGGILAPLFWSGFYTPTGIINPPCNAD